MILFFVFSRGLIFSRTAFTLSKSIINNEGCERKYKTRNILKYECQCSRDLFMLATYLKVLNTI